MGARSRWWGALSAVLVAAATAAVPAVVPAEAIGPNLLPLTVTNNSGRSEAVYLYVLGTDIRPGGGLGYVNRAGAFTRWPAGANPPVPAPDVSITAPGNGGSITLQVPRFISGRVYMSFGEKLKFFLTPDGLVQPAPWSPGDPNRNILFDWSEFTYNDAGLWLNSSQVDQFAVPHAVSVTGANGQTKRTGDLVDNGRETVIAGIRNQPGWANTILTRSDGTVLRVLAPGKAADAGLFSPTYLDPYITQAWNAYTGKNLTVVPFTDQPGIRYTGRTSGTTMHFTDSAGRRVASFAKPSTSNVWGCDGALHAPNDTVVGPIARTLCAALHRSTLGTIDTQPSGGPGDFYRGTLTNHYSRLIHQNMVDGKAYGFAFDDVLAQESLVHDGDPRAAAIILTPFGSGGSGPQPGGSAIASNWHNKCIDVPNWNFADGQRLIVWNCTGGTNQKWQFTNGTLRTENNKCMDVAWGSVADGAAVQIATCSGNPAQQFVLTAAGDLVNPQANKCVDIAEWNPNNDAVLQMWTCAGTANQKWRRI
ncbi:beta-1,3-glucanase family protein [Actinokineospora guangxiensis]|uniref:Beta-1,3-glucanase family protein n=1 Tax=Actinokineospora guangxiensis TaxID=1490288 RepID=A0ABW0EL77_9PSEU